MDKTYFLVHKKNGYSLSTKCGGLLVSNVQIKGYENIRATSLKKNKFANFRKKLIKNPINEIFSYPNCSFLQITLPCCAFKHRFPYIKLLL